MLAQGQRDEATRLGIGRAFAYRRVNGTIQRLIGETGQLPRHLFQRQDPGQIADRQGQRQAPLFPTQL